MKIYYAHCSALYGTPQEDRDIQTIVGLFGSANVDIVNPGSKEISDRVAAYKEDLLTQPVADPSEAVMQNIFKVLVEDADALVFRATPDGVITAGVFQEIQWAGTKPVLELPSSLSRREMSLESTREYLRETGQR